MAGGTMNIPQEEFVRILRGMWGVDEPHTSGELIVEADARYAETVRTINGWLARGDGAAVYRNVELGHPQLGHEKIVSFGSPDAQLEGLEAPTRLPDIGGDINWRYYLRGVYRGPELIVEQGV